MADRQPTFMFYSKSPDLRPGFGACEYIHPLDQHKYEQLSMIPDWRKKLSNFYEGSFYLDGHLWNSVEHYFHAAKATNASDYFQFTSEGCLGNVYGGPIKRAGRAIKMTNNALIKWDHGLSAEVMAKARQEKFDQNPDLMEALILTGDAKLLHWTGTNTIIDIGLMELRDSYMAHQETNY